GSELPPPSWSPYVIDQVVPKSAEASPKVDSSDPRVGGAAGGPAPGSRLGQGRAGGEEVDDQIGGVGRPFVAAPLLRAEGDDQRAGARGDAAVRAAGQRP